MWSLWKKSPGGDKAGKRILRCSFCRKTEEHVKKLLAGPTVYICNECVDLCQDILSEDWGKQIGADASTHGQDRAKEESASSLAIGGPVCSLCHLPALSTEFLLVSHRGPLCFACRDAILAAIQGPDEDLP